MSFDSFALCVFWNICSLVQSADARMVMFAIVWMLKYFPNYKCYCNYTQIGQSQGASSIKQNNSPVICVQVMFERLNTHEWQDGLSLRFCSVFVCVLFVLDAFCSSFRSVPWFSLLDDHSSFHWAVCSVYCFVLSSSYCVGCPVHVFLILRFLGILWRLRFCLYLSFCASKIKNIAEKIYHHFL